MISKVQHILLFPFALIYGLVIRIRNYLFDTGIIKATFFNMPVITIGNITVGGTGKTPHVEYLIRMLKKEYNIAVLSRGYKRKTRSFNIVETGSDVNTSGDEPLQIKQKHSDITVAVDRNRVNGVNEILSHEPGTDIIILDDAYQHRYIEPGLSILLIDYNRLITSDYLLPAGRLREHRSSVKRADIVLITKSPTGLSAIDMRLIYKKIPLRPVQHLYFTGMSYEEPAYIFNGEKQAPVMNRISEELNNVLLITGIAEPGPLIRYLSEYELNITHLRYPDHHLYTSRDYKNITDSYLSLPEGRRCIITTEKDAIRLRDGISEQDSPDERLFYLRINVEFLNNDADEFNKLILNYVRKNKRNNRLP